MSAKQSIYEAFLNGSLGNKNATEICKLLGIPYKEKKRLQAVLDELVKEGALYLSPDGKYGTADQLGLIAGVLNGNERGFAFLIPDDKEQYESDFFIFASIDLPLFLPKKVSLDPPRALIPVELPGCNKTKRIAARAAIAITAMQVTEITVRRAFIPSLINRVYNIFAFYPFFKFFWKSQSFPLRYLKSIPHS